MVVVVSADAKTFHVPGCGFIHNKDTVRTLTAKEAVREGYIPCLRCMRKYLNTAGMSMPADEGDSETVADEQVDTDRKER
jgi:methylphosphotriester-DNA--protein-cysteine methyltransferase